MTPFDGSGHELDANLNLTAETREAIRAHWDAEMAAPRPVYVDANPGMTTTDVRQALGLDPVGRRDRERQLRALLTRWQGHADEMLKQRDDFARLYHEAREDAASWHQTAIDRARQLHASRTLLKWRTGNAETGWLDLGIEVKVENGQLVVCWWRRVGTDFKGWLRAW